MGEYFNGRLLRFQESLTAMDAQTATGFGTAQKVEQFTNVMFEVLGADTPTATLKVWISYQDEEPVWTDPVTANNRYEPIACMDLDSQSALIAGSTGISISADGLKHYIVSGQGFRWINFQISSYTDGEVSVFVNPYNNQ